jgi:ApbE superfamily uncharacterized protein (UPF0280 family)
MKTDAVQHFLKTALLGFAMAATVLPASVSAADAAPTEMPHALQTSSQPLGNSWTSVSTQTITSGAR